MALTPKQIRAHCLTLPGATASVQWGEDHVFKVGGKMFAIIGIRAGGFHGLSFKVGADSFEILTRLPGIRPAPYLARAGWVALNDLKLLPAGQLKAYLARAHALIAAKLPKSKRPAVPGGP